VRLEGPEYTADAKTKRDKTVKVIAGQDTQDLVFQMLAAAVISGKIVDLEGSRPEGGPHGDCKYRGNNDTECGCADNSLLLPFIGERQANPPVQVCKPGVMVQSLEIGNGVKKNQAARAVSVRLL
jgi:hypothetical protein